ncbi:ATP-binding cassette domain-containing protein [Kineobactrum salinum]|uniref:ATP-binding cassette domain-containing protein n=1 Tax=Kineobactrum salinum TaxID=2708301 RepID=A0A6C0U4U5_9GAMM|nr:ATP-binding cassette domain-containing protein [Kineobactrum salinum]QIB66007.1 ATP-binding cassette domain-containing protein [Kineobactrum salinum]
MSSNTTLFSMRDISLVYRAKPVLRHIDWELLQGQHWACIGPNGAGKTSLARILSGQASHFSGQFQASPELPRQGVAYVCFEQAQALCARDRKLDDSEFRADASDPGTRVQDAILDGREPDNRFRDWVARLRMEHILQRGLRFISTGEMRKTLLVRALLSQPALLILDSPLDGLDHASQQAMREAIDELLQGTASVLLLCRQLEDIPAGVSHVLVLDNGRVLDCGERASVLAQPAVRALMDPPLPPLGALPAPAQRPYSLPDGPLLTLRDVSVSYGELQVLRGVNWEFRRGQHCCISGPNGCGKTTLLSLITGDNHKAYGQDITLFGRRRGSGESIWDIKQKYGQLDTQLQLNFAHNMRALEVVVSGFFDSVGLFDDWGDVQRHTAQQWLTALGLAQYSRAGFDTLSFGLQRMVLLARAMVKSPAILLLDEPTLGLDGPHRQLMLRAIDHIATHSDTQIIFVSHSAGDTPACINQQLRFVPTDDGFALQCDESAAPECS